MSCLRPPGVVMVGGTSWKESPLIPGLSLKGRGEGASPLLLLSLRERGRHFCKTNLADQTGQNAGHVVRVREHGPPPIRLQEPMLPAETPPVMVTTAARPFAGIVFAGIFPPR